MANENNGSGLTLDDIGETVLYDIFYEAGTRLGGVYVELMDKAEREGDLDALRHWRERHLGLNRERRNVDPADTEMQKRRIGEWNDRRIELESQL